MGYFSLPLAKLTGTEGKVYCVDIQEKMLKRLQKRADNAGLGQIVKPLQNGLTYNINALLNQIDFVMLFAVVHEVPDKEKLFKDLFAILKPGGKVLFAEPEGHVTSEGFEKSLQFAKNAGFKIASEKPMNKGLSAFLLK